MTEQGAEEPLYTLEGARNELNRRECAQFGHSTDLHLVGLEPVGLSCGRCGRSWTVTAKAAT